MKPARAFKIRYFEYWRLKEQKLTIKIDSLDEQLLGTRSTGKLWKMIEWTNWNQESTWHRLTVQYPGRTIVLVRCSYRKALPYLYLIQKTVEEAVTEVLEGK